MITTNPELVRLAALGTSMCVGAATALLFAIASSLFDGMGWDARIGLGRMIAIVVTGFALIPPLALD